MKLAERGGQREAFTQRALQTRSKRAPNALQMLSKRAPNALQTYSKRAPNTLTDSCSQMRSKHAPNALTNSCSQTRSKHAPNMLQTRSHTTLVTTRSVSHTPLRRLVCKHASMSRRLRITINTHRIRTTQSRTHTNTPGQSTADKCGRQTFRQ